MSNIHKKERKTNLSSRHKIVNRTRPRDAGTNKEALENNMINKLKDLVKKMDNMYK